MMIAYLIFSNEDFLYISLECEIVEKLINILLKNPFKLFSEVTYLLKVILFKINTDKAVRLFSKSEKELL